MIYTIHYGNDKKIIMRFLIISVHLSENQEITHT